MVGGTLYLAYLKYKYRVNRVITRIISIIQLFWPGIAQPKAFLKQWWRIEFCPASGGLVLAERSWPSEKFFKKCSRCSNRLWVAKSVGAVEGFFTGLLKDFL